MLATIASGYLDEVTAINEVTLVGFASTRPLSQSCQTTDIHLSVACVLVLVIAFTIKATCLELAVGSIACI